MAKIRVLLGVFCLVAAFGSRVSGSSTIGACGWQHVVRIAEKELGVRESVVNGGVKVDQYNGYVGLKKVAWCASFVSWVHGQARYVYPKTAWSPALFPAERLIKEPSAGMVMGIWFPDLKRIAHCGIVASVRGEYVVCIEGNTNINGGREGIGVFRRIRHKKSISSYADWITK